MVARMAHLRAFRRRRVHRAVRASRSSIAPARSRVAASERARVRPATRLADPSAVLGGARVQPGRRLVGRRAAEPRPSRRRSPWSSTGSCVQDVFGSPSPNGAFWSIAIEAQLYILFPLLLLVRRRWGAAVHARLDDGDRGGDRGGSAARRARRHAHASDARSSPRCSRPASSPPGSSSPRTAPVGFRWHWLALVAVVPVVLGSWRAGSVWTVGNFVWVDLALGPGDGAAPRRGRGRQAETLRASARDAGRSSDSAHARTACTSPTRRSW